MFMNAKRTDIQGYKVQEDDGVCVSVDVRRARVGANEYVPIFSVGRKTLGQGHVLSQSMVDSLSRRSGWYQVDAMGIKRENSGSCFSSTDN